MISYNVHHIANRVLGLHNTDKHSEKFPSVFGRHLISINIIGEILHLLLKSRREIMPRPFVRSISFLMSSCKNCPLINLVIYITKFIIMFVSCLLRWVKPMDGGCFQNACVSLTLPHPRLLILGLPPLCHFTPSLKCLISQKCAKLGLCLMLLHVLKVPHRFCKGSFLFEEPNIGIFFWDISTELGCHSKCHTWMHAYRA